MWRDKKGGTFSLIVLKVPPFLRMLDYRAGARLPACRFRCSSCVYFVFTSIWCSPFLIYSSMCIDSLYSSLRVGFFIAHLLVISLLLGAIRRLLGLSVACYATIVLTDCKAIRL